MNIDELERLSRGVAGWSNCNRHWPFKSEHNETFGEHVVGHINEEGEQYELMVIDADTYGTEGESAKLAEFYAAANPTAVLELIERVRAADADLFAARQALITEGMSRDSYGLKLIEMRADRDRLAAQNAELVAALEVFVDATKTWPMIVLTQGDIDRARAALAKVKGEQHATR